MAARHSDAPGDPQNSPTVRISVDLDVDGHGVPITSATAHGEYYVDLQSPPPQTQSMRLRLRKQASANSALAVKDAEISQRQVARLMKNKRPREVRAFKRRLQLSVRIALGVMLGGVVQTHGASRQWFFLPASYYLGGLTVASMMVIYTSASTVGGVLMKVWQINVGVLIALLYNVIVFACIPITQGDLIKVSQNLNDSTYYVSLRDWGVTLPLLAVFTLVMLISPTQPSLKKFAVTTNLYFMLTLVDPMNPVSKTVLKDVSNSSSYYGTANLLKQLTIYTVVGMVGTLIAVLVMLFPYPILAMRKLQRQIAASPHDIRDILNLIVDSYCFRAKDIKKMDFFKLRLDRLLTHAHERLTLMESLLGDCWWEEVVGIGACLRFNKSIAKKFVKLYAKLLSDLHAMKFSIEAETCHWTHVVLLKKMQTRFYVLQAEANDLLEDISIKINQPSESTPSTKFISLERELERLMAKYTALYGNLLSADVHTAEDVGKTMPLNVFVYSFHALVITLLDFEEQLNQECFPAPYRVKNFVKMTCRSLLLPVSYPRRLIIFGVRTTLAILIGVCCSTFIFAFSSTAPVAIAMVAENNIGGTYVNTVNRLAGLVAGTVVPSVVSFFVCKASDDYLYNALNNIVIFVWIVGSMYVWYSGRSMAAAGTTSAFMAASVLLDHSCRSTITATVSYASLTQNALGILILIILEIVIHPRSSRGLLRANVQQLLTQYRGAFHDVFRHHIAYNEPMPRSSAPLTEADVKVANALLGRHKVKALKDQLKISIPTMLKTQAKLVNDAALEPSLWKPSFSTSKYTSIFNVCRELVEQLGVLVDLIEWHENRRSSGKDICLRRSGRSRLAAECTAAFSAAQESTSSTASESASETAKADSTIIHSPRSPLSKAAATSPAAAKELWDQSLAAVEAGIEETFDTLATLFGEEFSTSNAEDHAIYLQMKEAFRIADVHRRGVVDASELAVLLEKIMPYYGSQGIDGIEQYVDEFMQLVDKDHDGQISFNEFMQALNEGFRLELEIYDEQQVPVTDLLGGKKGSLRNLLASPSGVRRRRKSSNRRNSSHSTHTDYPLTPDHDDITKSPQAEREHQPHVPPTLDDIFSPLQTDQKNRPKVPSSFVDASTLDTLTPETSKLRSFLFGDVKATQDTVRRHRFRVMSSASENSAPEALLNVESFTLAEATAVLKQSYGECLLGYVDDHDRQVTMEDFIVMSCVISVCENIATDLMRLNTLAAS